MSAKYTSRIRSFIGSCLIDGLTRQLIPTWTTNTNYTEGAIVQNESNKYVCKNTAISGAIPPTHVSGTASDGSINWIWIGSMSSNRVYERNTYLFIGKRTDWPSEPTPETATGNDYELSTAMKNITVLKKITSNDVRLAARRNNWTSGMVYTAYNPQLDPLATRGSSMYTTPFFVFTDDNNLYKCIDNNNGSQSTIKPTDMGTDAVLLADGYVWKFLGSLEASNTDFLTDLFVPVEYKKNDDSSAQWAVQQAAKKDSISAFKLLKAVGSYSGTTSVSIVGGNPSTGASAYAVKNGDNTLRQVVVSSSGEGYDTTQRVEAIVKATGASGAGATVASLTIVGGVITNAVLGDAGSGYSGGAVCVIVDPVNTPTTEANITVQVAVGGSISALSVVSGGVGYSSQARAYIIPGTAGAVAQAVWSPKMGHGYNIVTELCANNTVISSKLSSASGYLLTGNDSEFRQIGLITDVYDYGTQTPSNSLFYTGPAHPSYSGGTLNRINPDRGEILYLNNVSVIVRSEGQEEHLQFCLTL